MDNYETCVAKWWQGNKRLYEEVSLTDDGLIPESGTYWVSEGKYYIYRGGTKWQGE